MLSTHYVTNHWPCRYKLGYRSSRPNVFCEKGFLRNFAKFTGRHLCQSFLFNKVAGLKPATLFKKRLWRRCFPVNFAKFLRTPFLIEHLWWLFLEIAYMGCNLILKKWNAVPEIPENGILHPSIYWYLQNRLSI